MTAYFDTAINDLADLFVNVTDANVGAHLDALADWEGRIQDDCLVCAMDPNMPSDLRDEILRTVDTLSVWPRVNGGGEWREWETVQDLKRLLRDEWSTLHTLFHRVARWGLRNGMPLTDDPRCGLNNILNRADEARAALRGADPAPEQEKP